MATRGKPEDWLAILQNPAFDDLKLAEFVLRDLSRYPHDGYRLPYEDMEKLIALFTALRLDQLSKMP